MKPEHAIFSPIAGGAKKVAYTGTAGATATFSSETTAVWVLTTTDAFIRVGATAVADKDLYLPAYTPIVLAAAGATYVSAVQVASGGTLYACPVA